MRFTENLVFYFFFLFFLLFIFYFYFLFCFYFSRPTDPIFQEAGDQKITNNYSRPSESSCTDLWNNFNKSALLLAFSEVSTAFAFAVSIWISTPSYWRATRPFLVCIWITLTWITINWVSRPASTIPSPFSLPYKRKKTLETESFYWHWRRECPPATRKLVVNMDTKKNSRRR